MSNSKYVYVHLTYPIEIFENGEYKELNNCSYIEFEECAKLSNSNITNYEIHERLTEYIKNAFTSNRKIKFEKENDDNDSIENSNDSVFSNEDDSVSSDESIADINAVNTQESSSASSIPPQNEFKLIVDKNEIKPKIYSLNKTFKIKKGGSNKYSRKHM